MSWQEQEKNAVRGPAARMSAGIAGHCVMLCGAFGGVEMSVKNLWNADASRDCGLVTCSCLTRGKTLHARLAALVPRGLRAIMHACCNVWERAQKAVEHA